MMLFESTMEGTSSTFIVVSSPPEFKNVYVGSWTSSMYS